MATKPAAAARVTRFQPAATERWLSRMLAPTRAHIQTAPSAEAVQRIREHVLGETAADKPARTLAA